MLDFQWNVKQCLHLAGITLLWLASLYIYVYKLGMPQLQCILGSFDQLDFPSFIKVHWPLSCTAKQLVFDSHLGLCMETVPCYNHPYICGGTKDIESTLYWQPSDKTQGISSHSADWLLCNNPVPPAVSQFQRVEFSHLAVQMYI